MINLVSAKSIPLNYKSLIYIPEQAKLGSDQYNLKRMIISHPPFILTLPSFQGRKVYYGEITLIWGKVNVIFY